MAHFVEINQDPLPYSILQYIGRVAALKLESRNSQVLASNIDNGGRVVGLRTYVKYCA